MARRSGAATAHQALRLLTSSSRSSSIVATTDAIAKTTRNDTNLSRDFPSTRAAVANTHEMLRPGGVLLLTVPAVARISNELDFDDLWRFTADSTRRLLVPAFGEANVSIVARGNLVAANAFLAGLAASELSARELDDDDERFPVVIAARAERAV